MDFHHQDFETILRWSSTQASTLDSHGHSQNSGQEEVGILLLHRRILHKSKSLTPTSPKFKALVFMASRDAVDFHYQLLASTLPPDEMCDLKKTDSELISIRLFFFFFKTHRTKYYLNWGRMKSHAFGVDDFGHTQPLLYFSFLLIFMRPSWHSANASLVGASLFRLHGSMAQSDRTAVYTTFVKADRGILLATDVGMLWHRWFSGLLGYLVAYCLYFMYTITVSCLAN